MTIFDILTFCSKSDNYLKQFKTIKELSDLFKGTFTYIVMCKIEFSTIYAGNKADIPNLIGAIHGGELQDITWAQNVPQKSA